MADSDKDTNRLPKPAFIPGSNWDLQAQRYEGLSASAKVQL